MFTALFLAAPVLLSQAVAADDKAPCQIETARYVLRANPQISAQFHLIPRTADWPAGVAMELRFVDTGRTYWWLPTQGGTSDNHGFRWTALKGTPEAASGYKHKLGDLLYFAFGYDYAMRNEGARRGQIAPAHFFLHNMREAFWYQTDGDRREDVDRSLFDLVGCVTESAQKAPPAIVFPLVP